MSRKIKLALATNLVLALLSGNLIANAAEDPKAFNDGIDTALSMEFVEVKKLKKSDPRSVAVYKILDIQKIPSSESQNPTSGDVIELSFTEGGSGVLPWAELKKDGMVQMHIPKKYIKKRSSTSAGAIWRIENKDNTFALVKPEKPTASTPK
jgi:hypothetical protein